jgi:hypothetical protein
MRKLHSERRIQVNLNAKRSNAPKLLPPAGTRLAVQTFANIAHEDVGFGEHGVRRQPPP